MEPPIRSTFRQEARACSRPGNQAAAPPSLRSISLFSNWLSRTSARKALQGVVNDGPPQCHRDVGEAVDPDLEAGIVGRRAIESASVQMTRPRSTIALSGNGSGSEGGLPPALGSHGVRLRPAVRLG